MRARAAAAAGPDVVRSWAQAAPDRPPLLVLDPLEAFLDRHGLGEGPVEATPLGGGHSNLVYALRRGGRRLVLRRPPRPPLAPSTHDVIREARILTALAGTAARVPRVLAVGEDPAVIGAPFYVMEHLYGLVLTDRAPDALGPAVRRAWGEDAVDALVEIHAVDWRAAGLGDLGRPSGYLERQVRRFRALWEHNRTRDLPAVEHVADWLERHRPPSPAPTVVHGDYRLGNLMLAGPPAPGVVAVFDWELATIGDPLADLGYLTATWVQAGDRPLGMFARGDAMRAPGFPSREALVDRYRQRSGRSVDDIGWYRTLALWKTVVFMEGNHRRATLVGTDDPYTRALGAHVEELAIHLEEGLT